MSGLFNGREKCGYLGKERWPTREAAQHALDSYARAKGSKSVQPKCVFCDGYHLTKGERGNRKGRGK